MSAIQIIWRPSSHHADRDFLLSLQSSVFVKYYVLFDALVQVLPYFNRVINAIAHGRKARAAGYMGARDVALDEAYTCYLELAEEIGSYPLTKAEFVTMYYRGLYPYLHRHGYNLRPRAV